MLLQNIITVAYWYWVDNPKLFCQSCDKGMVQNVLVCCRFPFSGTAKPKTTASKTFPHHNHLCTKLQLTQCSQASAVVLHCCPGNCQTGHIKKAHPLDCQTAWHDLYTSWFKWWMSVLSNWKSLLWRPLHTVLALICRRLECWRSAMNFAESWQPANHVP